MKEPCLKKRNPKEEPWLQRKEPLKNSPIERARVTEEGALVK